MNNGLGFVKTLLATATGAFGVGTQIYAGQQREKALKEAIKREQRKMEDERRIQEKIIRAEQLRRIEEAKLALSMQRREEQTTALYGIAGVGLVVSGLFLYAALRKKK